MRLFIFNKFIESFSKFGEPVVQFLILSVKDDGKKNGRRRKMKLNWAVNPVGASYLSYF
jgi:hypothetical protein